MQQVSDFQIAIALMLLIVVAVASIALFIWYSVKVFRVVSTHSRLLALLVVLTGLSSTAVFYSLKNHELSEDKKKDFLKYFLSVAFLFVVGNIVPLITPYIAIN